MAIVSLVGRVDKRIVALPLIRACSIDGRTIVFTDDSNLKNVSLGKQDFVSKENLEVCHNLDPEGIKQQVMENNFIKHIFYVYSDYTLLEADVVIQCNNYTSNTQSELGRVCEELEYGVERQENVKEVFFSMNPVKKEPNVIVLKPEYYNYLNETEVKKELLILKDKTVNRLLANIMNNKIDMSKEQFLKLLSRKRTQIS